MRIHWNQFAPVTELVDVLVLGTSAARHGGSSPSRGTKKDEKES